MAITYNLVQLHPVVLFALCISLGALIAGAGTYFFRKFIPIKVLRAHNEVTGFLFLAIASFYGLLLGFVIFIVWGQLNETHTNVSKEGSLAMGLYRDIKYYPDTIESNQLMVVYLDFVFNVVNDEIPKMKVMENSRVTSESFSKVFYKMEHLNPKNAFQIQLVTEMFHHLNELAIYRGLRTASMSTEIPSAIWLPILFGALITLLCAMMLDIEHLRLLIGLNSLLGAFIGMLLFVIILLDHPYTGSLRIQPKSYYQIFTIEQWTK